MKKMFYSSCLVFVTSYFSSVTFAMSPLGSWITIDHATKKPSGVVEIIENQGQLNGKIAKGFGIDTLKYCHHCPGDLNNKPVIGLTFMWGFLPDGKDTWTKGHILDPHTGKIYRASMKLVDGGKVLQVRGYWGIFFQTETWFRKD